MELAAYIADRGGAVATWELHRLGLTRQRIAGLVSSGTIVRVRQGWYCLPTLPHEAQRAVRVGGQLGCSSGARYWGLWVPRGDERLHVAVPAHVARLRAPGSYRTRRDATDTSVVVHWAGVSEEASRVAAPVPMCLQQIAACHDPEFLAVVAESALNTGRISMDDWSELEGRLPQLVQEALPRVGPHSQSGIESLFVFRIRALGLRVTQQVHVEGAGLVDALIGDRLIVELDGEAFHRDDLRDRRRDAVSSIQGFRVLRFLARQVEHDWPTVEAAVRAAVARRDHLDPTG